MKHYGLFGEHLGHSLCLPIHHEIFQLLGIDADYRLIELPQVDFEPLARREMQALDGLNITIPYKQKIMPLLHGLDDLAERVGAVNTVTLADGIGYNTDVFGFQTMLRLHGIHPTGQPCWVLGTGGASRAIRVALEELGAESVTLVSRNPVGEAVSYAELEQRFRGVLINCTPAGMFPHADGCPLSPAALTTILPRATGVADLIYNPPHTVLTQAAEAAGIPACTGLSMLVAQAVEAESLWQKLPLGEDLILAVWKAMEERI